MNKSAAKRVSLLFGLAVLPLLLILCFSMRAEAESGKTVTNFTQLKNALESPNISEVYLGSPSSPLFERLTASEPGKPGITIKGNKKLFIRSGEHQLYFRSAGTNGFNSLFYVPDGAYLVIDGPGTLMYSPASRTTPGENCLIRVADGGSANVMETFTGGLSCSYYDQSSKLSSCSVFTLEQNAKLAVAAKEGEFSSFSSPGLLDGTGGLIWDLSNGTASIVLLGGRYYPGGQYLICNAYKNPFNSRIFLKDVEYFSSSGAGEPAKIFKAAGGAPPYAVYTTTKDNRDVAIASTSPFTGKNEEPASLFLSPGANSYLTIKPMQSAFKSRIRFAIKDDGDEEFSFDRTDKPGDIADPGTTHNCLITATANDSRRILKVISDYSFMGYTWSMEREVYIVTSRPGTEKDPIVADSYGVLKRALENPVIRYIKAVGIDAKTLEYADYDAYENAAERYRVTGDIKELDDAVTDMNYSWAGDPAVTGWLGYSVSTSAITPRGEKHLELTDDIRLTAEDVTLTTDYETNMKKDGLMYAMSLYNTDLTITGNGMLTFIGNSGAKYAASGAIQVGRDSSLVLDGAGIYASRNRSVTNHNQSGYACAVYVAGTGSSLTVKKGTYSGAAYKTSDPENQEYLPGIENAAIIADKGASVEILDGTFTDSYLGEKHQNHDDTYMGTAYARGTTGLGLVCDDFGNLLTASVSIKEGSFVTGLRKCTKNGTSFSFRPHDDFYSATLLPALSSSEAQAIYVKEHGGSAYFTGVTVNGPEIISEIDLEGTGYNAPEEDAYPHFGGINGSRWKIETGDISWIEYSTPNGDPTATITDGSGNKFRADYYYKLKMVIKVQGKRLFATDGAGRTTVSATFQGNPMTVQEPSSADPGPAGELVLIYDYGKCNKTTIEEVGVNLLAKPVHGMDPYKIPKVLAGTGYSWFGSDSMSWYVWSGNDWKFISTGDNDRFLQYGRRYQVRFYFQADYPHSFAAHTTGEYTWQSDLKFSLNGDTPVDYTGIRTDINLQNNIDFAYEIDVEKKPVDTVLIDSLQLPKAGNHPDTEAISAEPQFYDVGSVTWMDNNDKPLAADFRFKAGETYQAFVQAVSVRNDSGLPVADFKYGMKCYLNGKDSADVGALIQPNGDIANILILYNCPARTGTSIPEVSATVTEPVAGESPSLTATLPAAAQYAVNGNVKWYGSVNGQQKYLDALDKFEAGRDYVAEISLNPASADYYFAMDDFGNLNLSSLINAENAKTAGDADAIVISRTFSVPSDEVFAPAVNEEWNPEKTVCKVTLSCPTDGAKIYYTLDGSEPDPSKENELYQQAFTLTSEDAEKSFLTIKCIAVKNGMKDSVITVCTLKFKYTVSYDAGEGSGTKAPEQIESGQPLILPPADTFTPPGTYVFDKWKIFPGDEFGNPGDEIFISKTTVITALWTTAEYDLYFDANGGTGTMDPIKTANGGFAVLPENGFTPPEGKIFYKWEAGKDTGEYIAPGENFHTEQEMILYAVWRDPHNMIHHAGVDPTEDSEGSIEYWECSICHKLFTDADGNNEITAAKTVLPVLPDPRTVAVTPPPVIATGSINGKTVEIKTIIVYPKAVTWTGSKITKEQLSVLSEDGTIARAEISGIMEAIEKYNKAILPSKLVKISYSITGKKVTDQDTVRAFFKVNVSLNKKAVKKARIKGDSKKALQAIIDDLNRQLADKEYEFKIRPIKLSDDTVNVTIKSKFKKKHVQKNEDNSIKGLKSVTIKVKVPAGKNGKTKTKTYKYKASKALNMFGITITDDTKKSKATAQITALTQNITFDKTKTGVQVKP